MSRFSSFYGPALNTRAPDCQLTNGTNGKTGLLHGLPLIPDNWPCVD